jgi:hypothetical protein
MRRQTKPDRAATQRYHRLIDKQLNGKLSGRDEQELHGIEDALQLFEDSETSELERSIEQRHRMMMQQLSELATELRKFNSGGQPRSSMKHI